MHTDGEPDVDLITPPVCVPVNEVLESVNRRFIRSSCGKLHSYDCENFIISVPESKPGRYVVYIKSPARIVFVRTFEELKESVEALSAECIG